MPNLDPRLVGYLKTAIYHGSSDLHLKSDEKPRIRQKQVLKAIKGDSLSEDAVKEIIFSMLSLGQQKFLEENNEIDLAIEMANQGRFRVNAYKAQGKWAAVIRLVSTKPETSEALNLPPVIKTLAAENEGLVLVAGPTGSGKSTTLAAMTDYINENFYKHIITIENPVEILHTSKKSLVTQREIGVDTYSFGSALRSVLRQDPDVILVGEIRDRETAEAALQAAQTGHLVLSTIHAGDSEEAVARFINIFPNEDRDNMRETLAVVLKGILVQRLLVDADSKRRPALEIFINTMRAAELIRDRNHKESFKEVLATGGSHGMQTMEQHLVSMVQLKLINEETAIRTAPNPKLVRTGLRQLGLLND